MLTVREAIDACLTLPDSYEDYPFGLDSWAVIRRHSNKKMFASVYTREGRTWINVKAEPNWADFFKAVYPAVVPAYHMNKLHWISIILDGSMRDDEIFHLIDESYRLTAPKGKMAIESIQIQKVDKNTYLADNLLNFVENFSWSDVKEHTVRVIKNWEFEDWETPFVAIANGQIVGMVTIMKSDYYPLPEIFPWISTLFVSETFRGNRISRKLIDSANKYAKAIGFDTTYIPTGHIGLYEKYGYRYIRDIVNYGGDTDRLYAKELR